MASYRDRLNPEAIRFPCDLRIKALIVSGVTIDLCSAIGSLLSRSALDVQIFDVTLATILLAFQLRVWPREIVVDQYGLHSLGIFALRNIHIPWKDLGAIVRSTQVPGFGSTPLGLRNDTVEFQSRNGSIRIAHTPQHPDRERLLRELHLRHIEVNIPALL